MKKCLKFIPEIPSSEHCPQKNSQFLIENSNFFYFSGRCCIKVSQKLTYLLTECVSLFRYLLT